MSERPFVSFGTRLVALVVKQTALQSTVIDASELSPSPSTPDASTESRVVVALTRSRRNTSFLLFVSPETRLVARLSNTTFVPSAEISGSPDVLLPWLPLLVTLTRVVVALDRSWTKQSDRPLLSPETRLLASLANETFDPSSLSVVRIERLLACTPAELTLTRVVVPATRSRTKMSCWLFVSPATRLVATLAKATTSPSLSSHGPELLPLPSTPAELTLTRCVVPLTRSRTKMSSLAFRSPATRLVAALMKAT